MIKLEEGFLIEERNKKLRLVTANSEGELILSNASGWNKYKPDSFNADAGPFQIVRVYGRITQEGSSLFSVRHRKLLWDVDAPVSMTIEEIEKHLGHKVVIIKKKEGNNHE